MRVSSKVDHTYLSTSSLVVLAAHDAVTPLKHSECVVAIDRLLTVYSFFILCLCWCATIHG